MKAGKKAAETATVPQVARYLECTENHVRHLADKGALPSTRDFSNRRIFQMADVIAYSKKKAG